VFLFTKKCDAVAMCEWGFCFNDTLSIHLLLE